MGAVIDSQLRDLAHYRSQCQKITQKYQRLKSKYETKDTEITKLKSISID